MTRRVLFYVQHILGIGHLTRAARLVAAMREADLGVTVVLGGEGVDGLDWGDADTVQLPPIKAGAGGYADLVDANGEPVSDALRGERAELLLSAFDDAAPDALLIEAFPFGRRAMRFELLPLLEHARALDRPPQIACSARDILHENRKPKLNEGTVDLLNRYFDAVYVHGDAHFIALEQSFPLAHAIKPPVHHTGIVAPSAASDGGSERFDVIVSAGGGAVGETLLANAVEAVKLSTARDLSCLLVTGPNLSEDHVRDLRARAPDNLSVERFRSDFSQLLHGARLSVSQCGYNTAADILAARCPAVFVPSAFQGETEQTRRADLLQQRGLATVVAEPSLTAQGLAAAMDRELARASYDDAAIPDLNGARRTAAVLTGQGLA